MKNFNNYEEALNRLKNSLMYIIDNNLDLSDDEIEETIYQYGINDCSDFYIVCNEKFYRVNVALSKEDAREALENINRIEYMYDLMGSVDTVVGDVDTFMETFENDDLFRHHYMIAVKNIGKCFTEDEIKSEIMELFND